MPLVPFVVLFSKLVKADSMAVLFYVRRYTQVLLRKYTHFHHHQRSLINYQDFIFKDKTNKLNTTKAHTHLNIRSRCRRGVVDTVGIIVVVVKGHGTFVVVVVAVDFDFAAVVEIVVEDSIWLGQARTFQ